MDNQRGYNCAIFRNESGRKSSAIIIEAECAAFEKWGPNRTYTYVDPAKTATIKRRGERIVGFCYFKAGWKPLIHKDGRPHISASGQHLARETRKGKMNERTNFEKYLAGVPLNDELAAIRDGRAADVEPPIFPWQSKPAAAGDDDRELTRDERELLKEAKTNGMFTTLVRLQRKALKIHIRSATMESETDPLKTPTDVVNAWAYVKMYRRANMELEMLVDAEIAKLEGNRAQ